MNSSNSPLGLIVMLGVGLLAGFFLRPLIMGSEFEQAEQQVVEVEVVVTATPDPSVNAQAEDAPSTDSDVPLPTPGLMDLVMADARHIQGDEGAPVTIVEFSDFK